MRRLSVTPIDEADLEPVGGTEPSSSVPASSSLEDALATLLRQDEPSVGVTRDGRTLGVLTPDAVHRALRRSISAD
jgi:osmoprotectant transport system ATP-binding protein